MAHLPNATEMYGGDPVLCDGKSTPDSPYGRVKPDKIADRHDQLVKAMTAATAEGVSGNVITIPTDSGVPLIKSRKSYEREMDAYRTGMSKGLSDPATARLSEYLSGPSATALAKEWTLGSPISTGLVPFDLEAPSKLIFPRPTPLRNSLPREKGEGASRRFKVISGISGSNTGGMTTVQGGFNETSTNVGPGGLSFIRPPYLQYAGYDQVQSYVSYGLSDSVSWQAQFQGAGFDDIRSLSNTSLLYATMLLEERLILFGRGTTTNGYTGPLGTPGSVSLSAVSASVSPSGTSTLTSNTYWVVVAADAGDILGTNGFSMHQGPATAAASVAVTAGQSIQVTVGTDVAGALGYNLYVGSVSSGPFYYTSRTGYNVGYIGNAPAGGAGVPSVASGGADQSAVSTNFDGMLTNLAASCSYVKRLNAPFSTSSPGSEYQTAFATLYEDTKADPDQIIVNGFDRLALSNAILSGPNVNAYRVFIDDTNGTNGVKVGAVVQTILNEVTGKAVDLMVHPWMPAGNSIVRSIALPLPNSNISETFAMALVQDYAMVNWPPTQFTWDSSTITIGTLCSYAPTYSALLQGINSSGVTQTPPNYSDA
jgi:hypothetical protein